MSKFRINLDDQSVLHIKEKDYKLAKIIDAIGDIECTIFKDPFEFLVKEIVSQMLSKKVAIILQDRLGKKCGGYISPENIINLSVEDIRSIGISYSKSNFILNLTNAVLSEELRFSDLAFLNDSEVTKKLRSIKGIGPWTSKMYLLFFMRRPDILPLEDSAFLQTYRWLYETSDTSAKAVLTNCSPWKPFSSTAARYLYRALDNGITLTDVNLYLS